MIDFMDSHKNWGILGVRLWWVGISELCKQAQLLEKGY